MSWCPQHNKENKGILFAELELKKITTDPIYMMFIHTKSVVGTRVSSKVQ